MLVVLSTLFPKFGCGLFGPSSPPNWRVPCAHFFHTITPQLTVIFFHLLLISCPSIPPRVLQFFFFILPRPPHAEVGPAYRQATFPRPTLSFYLVQCHDGLLPPLNVSIDWPFCFRTSHNVNIGLFRINILGPLFPYFGFLCGCGKALI